jgi:hypothetical protein
VVKALKLNSHGTRSERKAAQPKKQRQHENQETKREVICLQKPCEVCRDYYCLDDCDSRAIDNTSI